jgi:hypothetical protein
LALAYADLPHRARVELVDAIHSDSIAEGINAAPLLAGLLGVEREADVARHIASVMTACAAGCLQPATPCRAFLSGDDGAGIAVLARPLHSDVLEVLSISWTREQGLTGVKLEPLIHERDLPGYLSGLREGARLERIPLAFAVDLIAPVLWHHRRVHGAIPALLARFAELFDVATR